MYGFLRYSSSKMGEHIGGHLSSQRAVCAPYIHKPTLPLHIRIHRDISLRQKRKRLELFHLFLQKDKKTKNRAVLVSSALSASPFPTPVSEVPERCILVDIRNASFLMFRLQTSDESEQPMLVRS